MRRVSLSIKYKMMLMILSIPLVLFLVYFYLSFSALKKDKIAYIYESEIKTLESMSVSLDNLLFDLSIKISNYKNSDKALQNRLFKLHEDHQLVVIDGQEVRNRGASDVATEAINKFKSSENLVELYLLDSNKGSVLFMFRDMFGLSGVNALMLNNSNVYSLFKSTKGTEYKLVVKDQGNILNYSNQIIKDKMAIENVHKTLKAGVKRIEHNNNYALMTFNKLQQFPLTIISVTDGQLVENSLNAYYVQFITLFVILIGIGVFSSIVLSSNLTYPILQLDQATDEISRGNFDIRLKKQSSDEIGRLSQKFNMMSGQIKELFEDLKEFNRTLDQKVKDRTKELNELNRFLKSVLDSLNQGIMVFDESGVALPTHSKRSERLVGFDPTGKSLSEILNYEDQKTIETWVKMLFTGQLDFDSLIELSPKFNSGDVDKVLKSKYFRLDDDEGQLVNFILTLTDISKEVKAQRIADEKQGFAETVLSVIKNRTVVLQIIALIGQIKTAILENTIEDEELLRLMHTLKGNSLSFNLSEIGRKASDLEDLLLSGAVSKEQIVQQLDALESGFFEKYKDVIKKDDMAIKKISVDYKALKEFESTIQNDAKLLQSFQDNVLYTPMDRSFLVFNDVVQDVSKKLGKSIAPITFNNMQVAWDAHHYEEQVSVLIHVFRNIVDHGIESSSKRQAAGKTEEGTITISLLNADSVTKDGLYSVEIKDDGQGINTEKIREKLIQAGTANAESMTEEQVHDHIFQDNVSSKDSKSDISGLGVGMSAVRSAIESQGGSITVKSVSGQGTSFHIQIKKA